jgi:tricorn protease
MARVLPGGKDVLVLSTESGEVELWKLPANGVGKGERLTTDGSILRWDAIPSPDGKYVAHTDKSDRLWLLEVAGKTNKLIRTAEAPEGMMSVFSSLQWSPDSRWIAFSEPARNSYHRIWIYSVEAGQSRAVTTDRYNSAGPAWSPDGKYLYFTSDRSLRSAVFAPWGPRAPEPFFDKSDKIYQLPLKKGLRSPFEPADELHPDKPETPPAKPAEPAKSDAQPNPDQPKPAESAKPADQEKPAAAPPRVDIDFDGIAERLEETPVPPGNYAGLTAMSKRLCWLSIDRVAAPPSAKLECIDIQNKGEKPETVMDGVGTYQLSTDGKKMLIRKQNDIYIVDSAVKGPALNNPKALADAKLNLADWQFTVNPVDEIREAFVDAWRLHRDYFYDKRMHGVNWRLMRDKYGELVSRVRDRAELNNLIAQMVSELSALHTSVRGGDIRQAPDQIRVAALGAYLEKDAASGGWTARHIYRHDPDRPDKRSPLAHPQAGIKEGDTIVAVNGRDTASAVHPYELLRNQPGKQVLLRIKPAGQTETRDVVVKPFSTNDETELRYHEWEYTRRLEVDKASSNSIGYVHLRAMGPNDINQWAEHFYPVFDRQALIVDVRHNGGGNIDSWILARLLRKAWMYWKTREGEPSWNMQYAFRGHIVVLQDEWTGSDGEAFTEGIKRLNIGKVIGTRSWGGEIWLTGSNVLVDRGVATAAEMGVFGPERQWLIEGHGVDPDIVVDNLPHATFNGKDAQLEAAIKHLQDLIKKDPRAVPTHPEYPNKSGSPATVSSGGGQ